MGLRSISYPWLNRLSKISKELLAVESSKAGDYGKYREDLEKWRLTLVQARERILKEESSIRAQRAVTFSVKAQNMGISPEEVARVFREKKEVFPCYPIALI